MKSPTHCRVPHLSHFLKLDLPSNGLNQRPRHAKRTARSSRSNCRHSSCFHTKPASSQARNRNRRWSWKNRSIAAAADVCLARFAGRQQSLDNAWKQSFALSLIMSWGSKTLVSPLANSVAGGNGLSSCATMNAKSTHCPLRLRRNCQSVVKPVESTGDTCLSLPVGPINQQCRFLLTHPHKTESISTGEPPQKFTEPIKHDCRLR